MWLRLMDLVVQPSCQTPLRLLSPPRPPSSWISPKGVIKAPELSLLQTPQVVKVGQVTKFQWVLLYASKANRSVFIQSSSVWFAITLRPGNLLLPRSCSLSEPEPWLPLALCSQPSPHNPSCAAAWGPHLWPRRLLPPDAPSLRRCAAKRAESLSSKRRSHVNRRRASGGPMG